MRLQITITPTEGDPRTEIHQTDQPNFRGASATALKQELERALRALLRPISVSSSQHLTQGPAVHEGATLTVSTAAGTVAIAGYGGDSIQVQASAIRELNTMLARESALDGVENH